MPESCRPTLMPGSAISTTASASLGRSPRRRAGAMAGASSSSWPISERRPLAVEAVRRIDALFVIERMINGMPAGDRVAMRQRESRPVVADLENWMRAARARLSRHAETAKAIDYMLTRWPAFTRFLDDGRICLSNNAAERALRGVALGRRARLFAGFDRGGERP